MDRLAPRDWRIQTPAGALFARSWSPPAAANRAPILLFHESLGSVELWRDFPEHLSRETERPVVAWDRLGFGRSDRLEALPEPDFVAAEAGFAIPALRGELGFSRFIGCGHSVGGGMAIEAAARFPDDCLAVVTMGAQAFVEDRTTAGILKAKDSFERPENLARLAKYHGDKARWTLDAWTQTWLSPEFAGWRLDEARARVRCPVLAIHGADDEYGSTLHPQLIAGKTGRVKILPGVGHFPHREAEAEVLAAIRDFLADLPG